MSELRESHGLIVPETPEPLTEVPAAVSAVTASSIGSQALDLVRGRPKYSQPTIWGTSSWAQGQTHFIKSQGSNATGTISHGEQRDQAW
jgi:hypothetical protein